MPAKPLARRHWPKLIVLRLHGQTTRQIGRELDKAHSSVAATLHHPEVKEAIESGLDALEPVLRGAMRAARGEAFEVLMELLGCTDNRVRLMAATAILDRTGITAGHTIKIEASVDFDPDKVEEELAALAVKAAQGAQ